MIIRYLDIREGAHPKAVPANTRKAPKSKALMTGFLPICSLWQAFCEVPQLSNHSPKPLNP